MTHLWTQDAFDCLCIRLSFSHWLSLLFPLVLTVPSILSSLTVREYCPHGFNTPDEYWCPLSSDCDCHADEKPAEQYDSGDDSAEKSAWWYNSGDDPAGVISQL